MNNLIQDMAKSPLFAGIDPGDMQPMLHCVGYHVADFQKGEAIALEEENMHQVGVILSGSVDMVKEDLWGNKSMLVRMYPGALFGETFACGLDPRSVVSYIASDESRILFMPFRRIMHTCSTACVFHHRLLENMVQMIAVKNRDLMRKVEVVSRKNLREKILAYLSIQAQAQDSRYFEIPLGRLELADYLCADRSALTRELANMKKDGLIDYDKNMFRML